MNIPYNVIVASFILSLHQLTALTRWATVSPLLPHNLQKGDTAVCDQCEILCKLCSQLIHGLCISRPLYNLSYFLIQATVNGSVPANTFLFSHLLHINYFLLLLL